MSYPPTGEFDSQLVDLISVVALVEIAVVVLIAWMLLP